MKKIAFEEDNKGKDDSVEGKVDPMSRDTLARVDERKPKSVPSIEASTSNASASKI